MMMNWGVLFTVNIVTRTNPNNSWNYDPEFKLFRSPNRTTINSLSTTNNFLVFYFYCQHLTNRFYNKTRINQFTNRQQLKTRFIPLKGENKSTENHNVYKNIIQGNSNKIIWYSKVGSGRASRHYDSHSLWLLVSHERPSYSPSPVVAQDGCTYQFRSRILVRPSFSWISWGFIAEIIWKGYLNEYL